MPTLFNPADCRVPCNRLGRFIDAGERISITDAEARDLEDSALLRVERDLEPGPESEAPKRAATRSSAKRGSKRAEVNKAPARETRG